METDSPSPTIKKLVEKAKEFAFVPQMVPEDPIDQDAVKEAREKIALAHRLESFERPRDIYQNFAAMAAKQLVFEARFAPSASERIKAADKILDRHEGRPVNRQVNMNATPSDFQDEELKNKTEQLMRELGYVGSTKDAKRLVQSTTEVRTVVPEPSGPEDATGEGPPEETDS